jgi:arginine decarboxylase-like protein
MTTAVEYLVKEIIKLTGVNIQMDEPIIEQAKQMEKEQICNAWYNSLTKGDYNSADEYYNETFDETIVTEYRDGSIDVETYKSK